MRSAEGKLFPRDGSVNRPSGFVSSFRSDKNKQEGEKKKKTQPEQSRRLSPLLRRAFSTNGPRLTAKARRRIGFLSVSLLPEGSLLDESYFVYSLCPFAAACSVSWSAGGISAESLGGEEVKGGGVMILAVRDNERRGDPRLGPNAPTNTAPRASGMLFIF